MKKMRELTEPEKIKRIQRIFIVGGLTVVTLLVGVLVWQFSTRGEIPIEPLDVLAVEDEIEEVTYEPAEEVTVQPIKVPAPEPNIPVGNEGGIPVTGPIGVSEEEVVESPEVAAVDMVSAVEEILEEIAAEGTEITEEEVEKAVEQVNNSNSGGNAGSNNNSSDSGSGNSNGEGNRKVVDGVEWFINPFTGEWVEKGPPGEGGTLDMSGNGVIVGY